MSGHRVVDDQNFCSLSQVRIVESASPQQPNTESVEITVVRGLENHFRILIRWRFRLSLDHERTTAAETKDRLRTTDRDLLHARQSLQAIFQFGQEGDTLRIFSVLLSTQAHLRCYQSIHSPAGIGIDKPLQAAEKKTGRRQQHHCECDFTNY